MSKSAILHLRRSISVGQGSGREMQNDEGGMMNFSAIRKVLSHFEVKTMYKNSAEKVGSGGAVFSGITLFALCFR